MDRPARFPLNSRLIVSGQYLYRRLRAFVNPKVEHSVLDRDFVFVAGLSLHGFRAHQFTLGVLVGNTRAVRPPPRGVFPHAVALSPAAPLLFANFAAVQAAPAVGGSLQCRGNGLTHAKTPAGTQSENPVSKRTFG